MQKQVLCHFIKQEGNGYNKKLSEGQKKKRTKTRSDTTRSSSAVQRLGLLRICIELSTSSKMYLNAVITKVNMREINWPGSPICMFRNEVETSWHLSFHLLCCNEVQMS